MTDLIFVLIALLIVILVIKCFAGYSCCDEEVTTTETIRQTKIAGPLKRQVEGNQFFVLDPADQKKIWINGNDDMYEDADGRIWRLV